MTEQQSVPTESGEGQGSRERFLAYFLGRLETLERQKQGGPAPDAVTAKMLDKAIFSTWLDCVSLGGKEAAEAIVRRYSPEGERRELSGSSSGK